MSQWLAISGFQFAAELEDPRSQGVIRIGNWDRSMSECGKPLINRATASSELFQMIRA
jgi:hypothetical protein